MLKEIEFENENYNYLIQTMLDVINSQQNTITAYTNHIEKLFGIINSRLDAQTVKLQALKEKIYNEN